jgi:hypothetical protein
LRRFLWFHTTVERKVTELHTEAEATANGPTYSASIEKKKMLPKRSNHIGKLVSGSANAVGLICRRSISRTEVKRRAQSCKILSILSAESDMSAAYIRARQDEHKIHTTLGELIAATSEVALEYATDTEEACEIARLVLVKILKRASFTRKGANRRLVSK